MLHCSGRLIPQVIAFLAPKLDDELRLQISAFQDNVVKTLGKKLSEEEADLVAQALAQASVRLKEGVVTMRKGSLAE